MKKQRKQTSQYFLLDVKLALNKIIFGKSDNKQDIILLNQYTTCLWKPNFQTESKK